VLPTNTPPLVTLAPDETTPPLIVINNPVGTVEEDKDNAGNVFTRASGITLNCNLLVPSSKKKCGFVFEVVPEGNIFTLAINSI
jgi:hypothetical protein